MGAWALPARLLAEARWKGLGSSGGFLGTCRGAAARSHMHVTSHRVGGLLPSRGLGQVLVWPGGFLGCGGGGSPLLRMWSSRPVFGGQCLLLPGEGSVASTRMLGGGGEGLWLRSEALGPAPRWWLWEHPLVCGAAGAGPA